VSVRTLKQEKYEFVVEENDTIDTLKSLIQEKLGHEKSWQNLIFSGTMLDPSRTIASYKITEKDFLVLLVKKPKEEVAKPAEPAKPATPAQAPAQPAAQPAAATAPAAVAPTGPAAPAAPSAPTRPGQPAQTEENEAIIRRIMEMGFERTQVERAIQASFGNADRAVELLMMGVPIPDLQDVQGLQAMQSVLDEEMDDEEEDDIVIPEGDATQLFEMFRNSPHFNHLRILARTNPDMLEQVLTQLPPQILNVISNNQEEFLRLLTEDPPAGAAGGAGAGAAGGAGGAAPRPQVPAGAQGAPGPQRTFNLSPEDQAIINNLVDMGFDKNRVTEAYLLFEKDADMTANYLLNHGWDDLPNNPTGQ